MKAKSQSRSLRLVPASHVVSPVESRSIEQKASAYGTVRAVGRASRNAAVLVGKTVSFGVSTARKAQAAVDKRISDATGIEFEWSKAAVTVVSAGTALNRRHGVRRWSERTFHDQPGHLSCFADINAYIDQARGRHHRIKHGHSIDHLGSIVKQFGLRGISGFAIHLLQDFTTLAGIPWLPFPRLIKLALRRLGLRGAVAASCVSVNLAGAIAVAGTALVIWEVGGVAYAIYGKVCEKRARTPLHQYNEVVRRLSQLEREPFAVASGVARETSKPKPRRKATTVLIEATALRVPRKRNSLSRRVANGRKQTAKAAN